MPLPSAEVRKRPRLVRVADRGPQARHVGSVPGRAAEHSRQLRERNRMPGAQPNAAALGVEHRLALAGGRQLLRRVRAFAEPLAVVAPEESPQATAVGRKPGRRQRLVLPAQRRRHQRLRLRLAQQQRLVEVRGWNPVGGREALPGFVRVHIGPVAAQRGKGAAQPRHILDRDLQPGPHAPVRVEHASEKPPMVLARANRQQVRTTMFGPPQNGVHTEASPGFRREQRRRHTAGRQGIQLVESMENHTCSLPGAKYQPGLRLASAF